MKNQTECISLESLLYLTDDELNTNEKALLTSHLHSCPDCTLLREDFLAVRQITIGPDQADRIFPDFSESVKTIIQTHPGTGAFPPGTRFSRTRNRTLTAFRYISGIAAVSLFVLFVWEQSISVHKISQLENRIQAAPVQSPSGFIDRITLARATFTQKQWNDLAASLNLNYGWQYPRDLLKIRTFAENILLGNKSSQQQLIHLLQTTSIDNRNALTLKNLIK